MNSSDQIRLLQWILVVALSAWLVIRGIVPGMTTVHSDFGNYYVSARLVADGANLDSLYNNDWFHKQEAKLGVTAPGKFAPFPPATAWLMLPLVGLSPINAQRAFTIINVGFLVMCAMAWKRLTGWNLISSLLIVLAGGASVTNNFAFGQVYLIMAALLLWSIVWVREGHGIAAGIILGSFAVVKYFPVVVLGGFFILMFVERQAEQRLYFRVVTIGVLTTILLVAAQLLYFGRGIMNDYFVSAFLPHLASELNGQGMYSFPFQSWDSLARNLFVYDLQANTNPWINWPAGRMATKLLVTTMVAGVTLWILLKAKNSAVRRRVFIALPSLAAMVILPASATYHFVLLLLPLSLLVIDDTLGQASRVSAIAIYVAIGFIPYSMFFGWAENIGVIFAYPRLWLVTLLFCIVAFDLIRRPTTTAS